jgi:CBS domain-containing protein
MAEQIEKVMTTDPATCDVGDSATEAAKAMRDGDFGAVIVLEEGRVSGILTDRDIVVRAVAEGRDPDSTKVGEIATGDATTLSPGDSVDDAVKRMREADVRRLPVVEGTKPVGIVSLGDLAVASQERSALADISAASPNN